MATVRQHLHNAIQESVGLELDENDQSDQDHGQLHGAMLLGWVVVAEWMAPDGDRWLSRLSGTPQDRDAAEWQIQGYLTNALEPGWDRPPDPDPDDDD